MKVVFQSLPISSDGDRARARIKVAAKEESILPGHFVWRMRWFMLLLVFVWDYPCIHHVCQHCGAQVEQLGMHGLSCKKSQGRHFRHMTVNDIIKRSLGAAKIPA